MFRNFVKFKFLIEITIQSHNKHNIAQKQRHILMLFCTIINSISIAPNMIRQHTR